MPPKRVSLGDRIAQDRPAPDTSMPPTASLWEAEAPRQEVIGIAVTQIMPNAQQPRMFFDEAALDDLATSIREHGVLQPILVRPISLVKWEGHGRRYEIIAGERRWRASVRAGLDTIPALIRTEAADPAAMIELALIENLQRADLNPLEEASSLGRMRDDLGYSSRRIAERIGRSRGYVENRLRLLDLDEDLQQVLAERPDTILHVTEIAKVTDPAERADLMGAVREGRSLKEIQARVRALLAPSEDQVDLRRSTDQRRPDAGHATSATNAPSEDQVDLRRSTDQRHQDAVNAPASSNNVDLRRSTDQRHPDAGHATSAVALSATERAALTGVAKKLEHWQHNPAALAQADRDLLHFIVLRLVDVLGQDTDT